MRSAGHDWAQDRLRLCGERAPPVVNLVVYAELLLPRADAEAVDELLDV
jgi:hypothetical protein